MDSLHITLRVGVPREIEALCEIDLDACELFTRAGLDLDLPPDHEFIAAERARWMRSLASGRTLVALGFSVIPETECGPEMLQVLAHERQWLPLPGQRVAMRMALLPPS